jgi:uncharacterized protein
MKTFLLRLLVVSIGLVAAPARADSPLPPKASTLPLWKVEGGSAPVFLLGSVHVLKEKDYPLAARIETAFSNASVVVFETDLDKMEDPSFQMQMLTESMLPENQTLKDVLSPETYKALSDYAKDAGLPMMAFDRLKPVLAAAAIVMMEMKKLDLEPEYGVDQHYFTAAKAAKKRIVPLETPEFQLKLLTGFSKEEGEAAVKSLLQELESTRKDLPAMITAWRTGDAAKLELLLNDARKDAPAVFQRLVTDRNRRWVPKLEELARGKAPVIVIVGAGHLVGKDSVVDLLQQKHWTVRQQTSGADPTPKNTKSSQ